MALNDKSSGSPEVANNEDAHDVPDAQTLKDARDAMGPAEKSPDGSAREDDVDDVHRDFLVGQDGDTIPDGDGPGDAPFTMPGGRTEGVPDEDR